MRFLRLTCYTCSMQRVISVRFSFWWYPRPPELAADRTGGRHRAGSANYRAPRVAATTHGARHRTTYGFAASKRATSRTLTNAAATTGHAIMRSAVLTSRDELRLPGGTFHAGDRRGLADYFRRLADDGAEAMTAPRGRFGSDRKELAAVFAELAQPIEFETKGQTLDAVLQRLDAHWQVKTAVDPQAERLLARPNRSQTNYAACRPAPAWRSCCVRMASCCVPKSCRASRSCCGSRLAGSEGDTWPVGWEPKNRPCNSRPRCSQK